MVLFVDAEVYFFGDERADEVAGGEPVLVDGVVAAVEVRGADTAVVPLVLLVKTSPELVVVEQVT